MTGVVGPPGSTQVFRVSHDGKRVVVTMRDGEHGTYDLGVVDIARNSITRITQSRPSEWVPVWSPDDRMLAYAFEQNGPSHIFMMPVSGGDPVMVTKARGVQYTYDWLRNGKILFSELAPGTQRDIWLVDAKGGSEPEPWLKTPFNEATPRMSPDGAWIAFTSNSSGQTQVYVAPYERPADRVQVSTDGKAAYPFWSGDGRELFWGTNDSSMYSVAIHTTPSFDAGKPQLLFQDSGGSWVGIDIIPGTNDFLIARQAEQPRQVELIENWRSLLPK